MELNHATQIAKRIVEILSPHCEKLQIAGSIRRHRKEVKDIEIVCLPKKEKVQVDLFGGSKQITSTDFLNAIMFITAKTVKGNVDGRYMQIICKYGPAATLDLFMPQPHDYYRQLAIRTGSAEYSRFTIANAWTKKGWVGTSEGLRLRGDCTLMGDQWACINKNATLPPVWQSEEEFFEWIGVPWVHPKQREIKKSVNA